MIKFFRTSLLVSIIGVTCFQGCLSYNHEIYYNRITSVVAIPNLVTLKNCTTEIYCIIRSSYEPDIYWSSNYLGMINDPNMTSINRGTGNTFIGLLVVRQCYRNASYTCLSNFANNRTEIGSVKVRLIIGEWECLDDNDCEAYPSSECKENSCTCKSRTSCIGINTPPVVNALIPHENNPIVKLNDCYKLLICEAQGYNMSTSWGIVGYGMLKPIGNWYHVSMQLKDNGIVIGQLLILYCKKKATYFCQATNQHGTVTKNVTIRMEFEKYQCWDQTDCNKYNGICSLHSCICKNGDDISLNNCSSTKIVTEAQTSSLSKSELNAIIVFTIIGTILITNLIIFILYRISRKRTKSSSSELINSNRY